MKNSDNIIKIIQNKLDSLEELITRVREANNDTILANSLLAIYNSFEAIIYDYEDDVMSHTSLEVNIENSSSVVSGDNSNDAMSDITLPEMVYFHNTAPVETDEISKYLTEILEEIKKLLPSEHKYIEFFTQVENMSENFSLSQEESIMMEESVETSLTSHRHSSITQPSNCLTILTACFNKVFCKKNNLVYQEQNNSDSNCNIYISENSPSSSPTSYIPEQFIGHTDY